MTTHEMVDADIAEVTELLRRSYGLLAQRECLSVEKAQHVVSQRASVECVRRESLAQRYMVARRGAEIVGVVAISGDTIEKLYVHPKCVGAGVGRALYESAESLIRCSGHRQVRLGAFPTAVPFYERMGLLAVGEKSAGGPLSGRTVVLMEKVL